MEVITANQELVIEQDQFKSMFPHYELTGSEINGDEVHLTLTPTSLPTCPECGQLCEKVHDAKMRVVRDIDSSQRKLFIHFPMRRVRCTCGCRAVEQIEWIGRKKRITNRLAEHVQKLLAEGVLPTEVARRMKLDWGLVKKINLQRLSIVLGKDGSESLSN